MVSSLPTRAQQAAERRQAQRNRLEEHVHLVWGMAPEEALARATLLQTEIMLLMLDRMTGIEASLDAILESMPS